MYRDDVCAVCGESLPPDHLYCREHAATVDERLHELGVLLPRIATDLERAATLLSTVAAETWDYLAEHEDDDPEWPPTPQLALRAAAEDVDVDVDVEPGLVHVELRAALPSVFAALAAELSSEQWAALARACANAQGAGATH